VQDQKKIYCYAMIIRKEYVKTCFVTITSIITFNNVIFSRKVMCVMTVKQTIQLKTFQRFALW